MLSIAQIVGKLMFMIVSGLFILLVSTKLPSELDKLTGRTGGTPHYYRSIRLCAILVLILNFIDVFTNTCVCKSVLPSTIANLLVIGHYSLETWLHKTGDPSLIQYFLLALFFMTNVFGNANSIL